MNVLDSVFPPKSDVLALALAHSSTPANTFTTVQIQHFANNSDPSNILDILVITCSTGLIWISMTDWYETVLTGNTANSVQHCAFEPEYFGAFQTMVNDVLSGLPIGATLISEKMLPNTHVGRKFAILTSDGTVFEYRNVNELDKNEHENLAIEHMANSTDNNGVPEISLAIQNAFKDLQSKTQSVSDSMSEKINELPLAKLGYYQVPKIFAGPWKKPTFRESKESDEDNLAQVVQAVSGLSTTVSEIQRYGNLLEQRVRIHKEEEKRQIDTLRRLKDRLENIADQKSQSINARIEKAQIRNEKLHKLSENMIEKLSESDILLASNGPLTEAERQWIRDVEKQNEQMNKLETFFEDILRKTSQLKGDIDKHRLLHGRIHSDLTRDETDRVESLKLILLKK